MHSDWEMNEVFLERDPPIYFFSFLFLNFVPYSLINDPDSYMHEFI